MRASRKNSGPHLLRVGRTGPRRYQARTAAGLIVAALVFGGAASVLLRGSSELLNPVTAFAAEGAAPPAAAPAPPAKPAPANPAPAVSAPATQAPATQAPATHAPATPAPVTPAPVNATTSKAAPAPAKPASVPARSTPSGPTTTKTGPAPATAASVPAKAGVKPVATPVRTPASGGAVARVQAPAAPAKSSLVQTAAHLDEHVTYQYNALGRRDPFQPILGGEYIGADVGGDAPVDIGGIKVVGIMWGASDKFALVEDGRGNSLVLRAGDKVMNGVVEALQREAVVVKLTVDGQTQSVAIPLTRKGDQNNASR